MAPKRQSHPCLLHKRPDDIQIGSGRVGLKEQGGRREEGARRATGRATEREEGEEEEGGREGVREGGSRKERGEGAAAQQEVNTQATARQSEKELERGNKMHTQTCRRTHTRGIKKEAGWRKARASCLFSKFKI